MHGEFNLTPENNSPLSASLSTFLSFLLIGFIPLVPFLFPGSSQWFGVTSFQLTCVMTGVAFVIIGLVKSQVNQTSTLWAILETLALGAAAAAIAYYAGYFLESLFVNA
jgi:VIT1/CCC1 family predicted Fe2+/Mn2+ transporter